MSTDYPQSTWLRRLRHDLLKPALWVARDLREIGAEPSPAERAALRRGLLELVDLDGAPVSARELFRQYCRTAPAGLPAAALEIFDRALCRAEAAVSDGPIDEAIAAVMQLESAFAELARHLESRT